MTLAEFCENREHVVVFWAGIGCPMGDYAPAGYPDMDFVERRELLDLDGKVDPEGCWRWLGEGRVFDDRGNSIQKLEAYCSEEQWKRMVSDYEAIV
jgi:hypothetical protein